MNVLLTSAGRRGYLVQYFKEALNGAGKVYASNSVVCPAFYYADESVISPQIYDEQYIAFLLEFCREKNIRLVVSFFDIDLPVLSANRKSFEEQGVICAVSAPEVIEICNDKWRTYQFCLEQGINTPHTFLKLNECLISIKQTKLSYPLIVKPRWGMGSLSIFEADNEDELIMLIEKAKRRISNSYLKYESIKDSENCIIIQQRLTGAEYHLDVINDFEGNYKTTIAKRKLAMRSGETDSAKIVDVQELTLIGEQLSSALRHYGNLDVDIMYDGGTPYILELNGRIGGGYPFSHIAGINLPQAYLDWAKGVFSDPNLFLPGVGTIGQKDIAVINVTQTYGGYYGAF